MGTMPKTEKVTVRFAGPHIHEGKPFEAGDVIEVDARWAAVLKGQGHTVSPKE